jgi:hypothetical protein
MMMRFSACPLPSSWVCLSENSPSLPQQPAKPSPSHRSVQVSHIRIFQAERTTAFWVLCCVVLCFVLFCVADCTVSGSLRSKNRSCSAVQGKRESARAREGSIDDDLAGLVPSSNSVAAEPREVKKTPGIKFTSISTGHLSSWLSRFTKRQGAGLQEQRNKLC